MVVFISETAAYLILYVTRLEELKMKTLWWQTDEWVCMQFVVSCTVEPFYSELLYSGRSPLDNDNYLVKSDFSYQSRKTMKYKELGLAK